MCCCLQLKDPTSNLKVPTWEEVSLSVGKSAPTLRGCYKEILKDLAVVSITATAGFMALFHPRCFCASRSAVLLPLASGGRCSCHGDDCHSAHVLCVLTAHPSHFSVTLYRLCSSCILEHKNLTLVLFYVGLAAWAVGEVARCKRRGPAAAGCTGEGSPSTQGSAAKEVKHQGLRTRASQAVWCFSRASRSSNCL